MAEEKIFDLVTKIDIEYDKEPPNIKPLKKEVEQLIDDMRNVMLELKDDITENVFFCFLATKSFYLTSI